MNIGVIGQGFVGSALREGLRSFHNVLTYDIDENKCNSTHDEICIKSDIIFLCLPTPMRKDGSCDIRILEEELSHTDWRLECALLNKERKKKPIVVIKSTMPPGSTKKLFDNLKFKKMELCFSPEFLTEANSFEDFKNQTRIIIGGDGAKKVKQMFRKPFPNIPIVITRANTAEMVKYFINCFLSTKVTFANQMYDLCEASGIDYDKVCEYALLDQRIGGSHLAVPGPDGDRGYGGHCFPKDMSAMIYFGKLFDVSFDLFSQVVKSNSTYRKNKDWLDMKGRAVSED